MPDPRRVLLVEPFMGGSHAGWAEGLIRHSRHDIHLVAHPGVFWRWRMRGSALTLAARVDEWVSIHGRPEVLLVSAMTDIATLLGLARRSLGPTPVVAYFHENQLTYPHPDRRPPDELGYRNWLSMAAVDRVLVNSFHHRHQLLGELSRFLPLAPDLDHLGWLPGVERRTYVVPVGAELAALVEADRGARDGPPVVLWNHRFDPDKQPETVFSSLEALADEGVDFRVAITGFDEWSGEPRLRAAVERLDGRVDEHGWLDAGLYRELLTRTDVVVSAARHEFFGVSVVEAVAAGAVPVLPRRLSYPEIIPGAHHDAVLYDADGLTARLRSVLTDLDGTRAGVAGLRRSMLAYDWSRVAPQLDRHIDTVSGTVRAMITAVEGVRVGHWTGPGTGCTVVVFPEGTIGSGEVRGGAPATREFALLEPGCLVDRIDAVVLTGGSAFGLATADGVMAGLAQDGAGFATSGGPVPIVVAMALFDLAPDRMRPGAEHGRAALAAAVSGPHAIGRVGAGTGATLGKWRGADHARPAGLGAAAARSGDLVVATLVAVNATGDLDDGSVSGTIMAGTFEPPVVTPFENTTIGCVVTNAALSKLECRLLAQSAHDGYGRALVPAHTAADGDAVVAAATGQITADVAAVRLMATAVVEAAVRSV